MIAMKIYCGYTVSITTFYVGLWHEMYMALGTWAMVGAKNERNYTCSFEET